MCDHTSPGIVKVQTSTLESVRNSLDIFQEKMNKMFHIFDFIWAYIQ